MFRRVLFFLGKIALVLGGLYALMWLFLIALFFAAEVTRESSVEKIELRDNAYITFEGNEEIRGGWSFKAYYIDETGDEKNIDNWVDTFIYPAIFTLEDLVFFMNPEGYGLHIQKKNGVWTYYVFPDSLSQVLQQVWKKGTLQHCTTTLPGDVLDSFSQFSSSEQNYYDFCYSTASEADLVRFRISSDGEDLEIFGWSNEPGRHRFGSDK